MIPQSYYRTLNLDPFGAYFCCFAMYTAEILRLVSCTFKENPVPNLVFETFNLALIMVKRIKLLYRIYVIDFVQMVTWYLYQGSKKPLPPFYLVLFFQVVKKFKQFQLGKLKVKL